MLKKGDIVEPMYQFTYIDNLGDQGTAHTCTLFFTTWLSIAINK